MYFKSVNRGISFTKSGTYVLSFVILLGVLAAASGYNALFLALAFGSGLLITSGLLSERSIKSFEVAGGAKTFAEAGASFRIQVALKNSNSAAPLFGNEIVVTEKVPRFRLFHPELPALGLSHFLRLFAGEQRSANIACTGLTRGIYPSLPLVLRTLYPFGLIAKFKVGRLSRPVVVHPRINSRLLNELRAELRTALRSGNHQPEFHSHRRYTSEDSVRRIDWRKSAGKAENDWAVKVYVEPHQGTSFLVQPEWREADGAAPVNEQFLSDVLTACEAVSHEALSFALKLPQDKGYLHGAEAIREYLAAFPAPAAAITGDAPPNAARLIVGRGRHRWEMR